jgi:hypothetical protein
MSATGPISEGKKEACKTYLEQTKLLVTLASAFLFAPAGLIAIVKDRPALKISSTDFTWFVVTEALFVVSVLAGYVAIGSVTGSQDSEAFNVFRPATRISSLIQFGCYLLGIILFIALAVRLLR